MKSKIKYPRLYISGNTHQRVKKLAKDTGKSIKEIGNRIVIEGLKSLGY